MRLRVVVLSLSLENLRGKIKTVTLPTPCEGLRLSPSRSGRSPVGGRSEDVETVCMCSSSGGSDLFKFGASTLRGRIEDWRLCEGVWSGSQPEIRGLSDLETEAFCVSSGGCDLFGASQ